MAKERFDHVRIEQEAQQRWADERLFETNLDDSGKDPYYLLFEFPYPSGDLHIGHWFAYAVTDIYARYLRLRGKNVLFPIGFDAFGLPAENAAMKQGADPKVWTYENMEKMRKQIRSIGASLDWSKEVVTSEPMYYKWTQWLFAKLYEHGLAYRKEAPVKWCPKDQTVLANEQVIDGKCERCGTEVEEKNLTQWFFKIADYAPRLLEDLDTLPWRDDIKDAQRAWIGKSEGARLWFPLSSGEEKIEVFTTRPDTVFGATYVVLAPEHPLIEKLILAIENEAEVVAYQEATKKKTERERSENKEKTGVALKGITVINPATKKEIPVYVADYVLGSYGTGAVMAVPAHDERDFAFAKKHKLPLCQVVIPDQLDESNPPREGKKDTEREVVHVILRDPKTKTTLLAYLTDESWGENKPVDFIIGGVEEGETHEQAAIREIQEETGYTDVRFVEQIPLQVDARFFQAQKDVNRLVHVHGLVYELVSDARVEVSETEKALHNFRWVPDAKVAREITIQDDQFFWEYLEKDGMAFSGDGTLANSGEFSGRIASEAKWEIVSAVGGERTTNYRIRDWLVSRQRYWGCPIPIVYDPSGTPHVIPAEHLPWLLPTDVDFSPTGKSPLATSKELHERVQKIFGEGWTPEYDTLDTFVDSSWYYLRYLDPQNENEFSSYARMNKWLPVDRYSGGSEHVTMHLLYSRFFHKALFDLSLVPYAEPFGERFNRGLILGPDGQKMSKRWGNVINPDDMLKNFGADAVRAYLAFIGPYNEPGHYPWNLDGVSAMRKFLDRVYALHAKIVVGEVSHELTRALAKAGVKIAEDADRFKFNTALSVLMVLTKEFERLEKIPQDAYQKLLILITPFAPHLAEHLWTLSRGEGNIQSASWPEFDASFITEDEVVVIVQVNGKKKGELLLIKDLSEEEATAAALRVPSVHEALKGQEPSRVIYVPGRIINIVAQF